MGGYSQFYGIGTVIWIVVFVMLAALKPFASIREAERIGKVIIKVQKKEDLTAEEKNLMDDMMLIGEEKLKQYTTRLVNNGGAALILLTSMVSNAMLFAMFGREPFTSKVSMAISVVYHAGIVYQLLANPFKPLSEFVAEVNLPEEAETPAVDESECDRCVSLLREKLDGQRFKNWALKNHPDKIRQRYRREATDEERAHFQQVSACKSTLENNAKCGGHGIPLFSAACSAAGRFML
jgi:hypothetical protein